MSQMIYNLIGSLIIFYAIIYSWSKLLDTKIDYKNIRFYICWILISLLSIVNSIVFSSLIRIIFLVIELIMIIKFLFNTNNKNSIVTPLFTQIIIMLSEALAFVCITVLLNLDINQIRERYMETIIINVIISIIYFLIISIPFTKKVFKYLIESIDKLSKKYLLFFSIIVILIANIVTVIPYYSIDVRVLVIINTIFSLICFFIVLHSFRVQNNYNKVSNKYNVAINSLNEYEKMMTKYRIENHENKNLLLTIRTMILNKDNKITNYIDSIVQSKYNDSEKLLNQVSVIPSGGLRATIYSEILKIQNKNIPYSLNLDKRIKTVDLIEIDTDVVIDICKVVGVFVDNAIEAQEDLDEKNIAINLYIENNLLNIKVSNNYNGKVDIDKIYDEGYTTKNKGHGYGLSLVKKIVNNNSIFHNDVEISKNVFNQILRIKYKKF